MRAASRVSTGTPLTAAESSTIEKPIWAHSRIIISSRLLRWKPLFCSQATGPQLKIPIRAFRMPIWVWPLGS